MGSLSFCYSTLLQTILNSRQRKISAAVYCCTSTTSTPYSKNIVEGNDQLKPIVVNGDPPTFVSASGRRIVAVGDLHGDLDKARYALEMAGILSSDGQDLWVGGQTVLIQLGDILDRGGDEIAILSLLRSLDFQAKANGGAVFQVKGNHETMNVEGDFRYVDSEGFDECADFLEYLEICDHKWEEAFVGWVGESKRWKKRRMMSKSWGPWNLVKVSRVDHIKNSVWYLDSGCSRHMTGDASLLSDIENILGPKISFGDASQGQRQKGVIARSILLRPGGPLASELARHAVVIKVDDWVFCHGGLLPHHVDYGIERMNREVSYWMKGVCSSDDYPQLPFIATRGYDSVVWSRLYSRDTSYLDEYQINQIQSILRKSLQAVGAKAMVVGHTPQATGINSEFNGSVWRIDVGMSSGVLDSRPEVLEIREGHARPIRSRRDKYRELQLVDFM